MAKRGGRPTVITDKVLTELKTAFHMDCTDAEACLFADISEKTLYNYQRKNPEFLQLKQGWKSKPIFEARKTVCEYLEKDAHFALRYLSKKLPHEFGSPSIRNRSRSPEMSDELRESIERTNKMFENMVTKA
jgi:hypothetical protein